MSSADYAYVIDPAFKALEIPPVRDESTNKREYIEINPDNGSAAYASSEIQFNQVNKDIWVVYQESYVYGQFEITEADGTPLDDTKAATAAQSVALMGGAASIFTKVRLELDNKLIEEKDYPGLGVLVRNYVEASEDYLRTSASNSLIYIDGGAGGCLTAPIQAPGAASVNDVVNNNSFNPAYNPGWVNKARRCSTVIGTAGSRRLALVNFIIPLSDLFGWAKDTSHAMIGQRGTLTMYPQTSWTAVLSHSVANGNPTDYAIRLRKLTWWIPKLVPSLSTERHLINLTATEHKFKTIFRSWQIYRHAQGTAQDIDFSVTTVGNKGRPVAAIVFFQQASQLNTQKMDTANKQGNYGVFDNAGVDQLRCWVNEQQFPEREYRPDFSADKQEYQREYHAMLEYACKDPVGSLCQVGSAISYELFGTLYPFFCFDISRRDVSVYQDNTESRIRIQGHRATNTDVVMYVMLLAERELLWTGVGKSFSFQV